MIVHAPDHPDDALETAFTFLDPQRGNNAVDDASRNGPVRRCKYPVMTVWDPAHSSVSLNPVRDANPFFHLFEACWMMAGRNDVAFVKQFNQRMDQFSDDGDVLHGAYGFRWREWFNFDQLTELAALLRSDPTTRRAVLTMWSPEGDLVQADAAIGGGLAGKDIPCNTQAYFRIVDGALDMTLTARSNDAVWGAYGANIVHFGMLHGWMAWVCGVKLGSLYQLSNDLHIYLQRPDVEALHQHYTAGLDPWTRPDALPPEPPLFREWSKGFQNDEPMAFLAACEDFCEGDLLGATAKSHYMRDTVAPMRHAWDLYKADDLGAAQLQLNVGGNLWHYAAWHWLQRRIDRRAAKAAIDAAKGGSAA